MVSAPADNVPPKSARDEPRSVIPIFGLQYSRLQGLAGSLGVGVGREEPRNRWRGLVALVEPGAGGFKVQVGAGWVSGAEAALFARGSWLRTWGHPGGVSRYQNYAGTELEGVLLGFNVMVGLYRHVGGSPIDQNWVGTAGVGLWY
ncbi:hypothetical protein [Anaeromyxobacter oryzisoli]|uniref:hypothetical protein n=1 Tax=Anaeromyxobacter oryzisoli TaxID=2925408 RepID=UPI001F563420|nr:hypothetical protein [Anaeromyxobacter sp. SG63]